MKLTVPHIGTMQRMERDAISVSYHWQPHSSTPEAKLARVFITFLQPDADRWKWLMTQETDGFEISVSGTRNKPHDGLDDCYVAVLEEVNKERAKIGLKPLTA